MKIKYIVSILSLGAIAACASTTTVIPQIGDMKTVISYAKTEKEAGKAVNYKAHQICTLESQEVKMIDLDTTYQGNDPNQKALISLAKKFMPKEKTSGPFVPENYTYKATLTFKCI